jgi:ubiquinone/menaquinone biosynthesis C-methylase UbiE
MTADRTRRARSFGSVAEVYERARPIYPDDAVRWLAGTGPHDVVDLGAGTGKLTRSLVALGHRVTAVEPSVEMLEQLRSAVPDAVAVEGSAESIPLAEASADVVTAAQAFHWFDQLVALREIARVLRPGGRIALVWNARDDRVEWVAELTETVIGRSTFRAGGIAAATTTIDESGPLRPRRARRVRPRADAPAGRAPGARPLPQRVRGAHGGGAPTGARALREAVRRACP